MLCWSIDSELDEALTWAFVGGIVQDLMSAAPLGTSALGLVLIVFMVWRLSQGVFRVGPLLLTALVVAGTVIHQTVFALVLAVVGLPGNYLNLFSYVIVPSAVYNLAVVAFVYLRRAAAPKTAPPQKSHLLSADCPLYLKVTHATNCSIPNVALNRLPGGDFRGISYFLVAALSVSGS